MGVYDHTVEQIGGSQFSDQSLMKFGLLNAVANHSSAGGISSVTVGTPGSYATIPTLGTSGNGSGATLVAHMGALTATVQTPQASTGSYAPADTVTLTGGTESSNAVLTVATTQVVSATVAAGGTGGTTGTQTVTGTTGTGTKFQASVTVSGGAITAVLSITVAGNYTVNPTSLTAEPVTGAGLSGAQLNVKMGVLTATVSTPGSYTVLPTNPVSQGSTSGSGTGATFNINTWSIASISVSAAGTAYDNTSALTITGGGSTGGGAGSLVLNNAGNAVTVAITQFPNLPASYSVFVKTNQACFTDVTSKTTTGFNVVLTPTSGSTTISAGTFDVLVVA